MRKKFVGVLGRNAVLLKLFFGKVFEIVRDDDVGPPPYRSGQHVLVFWIGKMQGRDEVFEMLNQTVADVPVHQCSRMLQNIGR